MTNKILSAKMDFMFKQIFGNPNNNDILASFLLSVLDLPRSEYEGLSIVDPHLHKDSEDDKLGILDVKIKTVGGNIIDIEIQIFPMTHIRERVVFYMSKMITEQINSGNKYSVIKRAVSIVITNYIFTDDLEYHHRFRLIDIKTGLEYTNLIEVDTLELPKLPEKGNNDLWAWLKFLNTTKEDELNILAARSAEMGKAVGVLMKLSADDKTRQQYEAREKAWRDAEDQLDYASAKGWERGMEKGMERGMEKGMEKGIEKGRLDERKSIVKKMLQRGRPIDEISDDMGLSIAEINSFLNI